MPATLTPTTFADGTGPGTLRNAIAQANTNGQDNTILLGSGTYTLTPAAGGELALTGVNHALTIQGTGQTIIHAGGASRVFEVIGNVQVTLANLTLAGGLASDGGSLGGADARGGAMLINGGNVTLRAVDVAGDVAQAGPGANAYGGGIYANVATLTLINSLITGNRAQGGAGVAGANGGSGQAGAAGQGGGAALGGGLFAVGGSLSISGSTISGNAAIGGDGGAGGQGGNRNIPTPSNPPPNNRPVARPGFFAPGFFPYGYGPYGYGYGPYGYGPSYGGSTTGPTGFTGSSGFSPGGFSGFSGGGFSGGSGSLQAAAAGSQGGDGGVGGVGGKAQGGGLYLSGGMINLAGVTFSGNRTQGGTGGRGGDPGTGNPPGVGGDGGAGGLSQGAGVYVASGAAVTLTGSTFSENVTADGLGGTPGAAGSGSPAFGFTEVGQGERLFRASGGVTATPPLSAQDTVGAFDPGFATWYLRNENGPGPADASVFVYGGRGWRPVVGDWNGDGIDTVGVVDPNGVWYLRNENSPGAPDITPFAYGAPGWIPVVGDWNGTGHTGIGMFDPSTGTWYLRNEDNPGPPDAGVFRYGGAGWRPVVGDWRGDGITTIGAVDPADETWYLRDSNSAGPPTIPVFRYGAPGWAPVAGDWTNNGSVTVGAVDPETGTWYLRNENSRGAADAGVFAYGAPHWRYVTGHWRPPTASGLPERAAGGPIAHHPGAGGLTSQQLQQTVSAALERLREAGVSPALLARLGSVKFEIGQLHGGTLGYAYAKAHTVVIDTNAAGYGWFVDSTPLSDEEFARNVSGQLAALSTGPAAGHMDLLTVVLHELGHISGRGDVSTAGNPNYLMDDTLATGLRRTDALDAVFSGMANGRG